MAMTFSTAVTLYRQHLRARRRAPTTITWYGEQFDTYERWRVAAGLPDVLPTNDEIDAYLAEQQERHKPATVHARFRALRALCNWLQRRKKIAADENPFTLLSPEDAPHVPQEIRPYPSADDVARLLASIPDRTWLDHRDRLIVLILYYSGLRRAELCALEVADIDTQRLQITVAHGKGNKARIVPCTEEVRHVLAAYLFCRPKHTERLLLASDGYEGVKGLLQAEGVRQMLIRRCRAAEIPYRNPHAFRHGLAMMLLNNGMRLTSVAKVLGHSDPAVTHKVYAHTLDETVRREYEEALRLVRRP